MIELKFLIREPLLPLIIDTGDGLIAAKSWAECYERLEDVTFTDAAPCQVIESTAEVFSLYPEKMLFSPLTLKKRWTKAAIINLYNSQKGPGRPEYRTKSLGNKSLEKVFGDIVVLLAAPSGLLMLKPSSRGEEIGLDLP